MSEENKSVPEPEELTAEDLEQISGGDNGTHIPKTLTGGAGAKVPIEGIFKF